MTRRALVEHVNLGITFAEDMKNYRIVQVENCRKGSVVSTYSTSSMRAPKLRVLAIAYFFQLSLLGVGHAVTFQVRASPYHPRTNPIVGQRYE